MKRHTFRWLHPPGKETPNSKTNLLGLVLYVAYFGVAAVFVHFRLERLLAATGKCCLAAAATYVGYQWTYGECRPNRVQLLFQERLWLMPLGCLVGFVGCVVEPPIVVGGAILGMVSEWRTARRRDRHKRPPG